MNAPATVQVDLSPKPGFCIKSTALDSAVCRVSARSSESRKAASALLPDTVSIPQGMKIFVNVAWDANVPPPPEGSEDVIQKAMSGEEDVDEEALASGRGWFVPVVVSEPRTDVDKAGKPSVIFDCVYNASLKSRTLRDVAFKTFLIELALQRVEAQHNLSLSRQIGTPNIASKGKLAPRTALVPLALFPVSHALRANAAANQKKLIEEVNVAAEATRAPSSRIAEPAKPKGILKNGTEKPTQVPTQGTPKFEWTKEDRCIRIRLQMPGLTRDDISSATLDVEPRRIILDVPAKYHLDVDLSMSDAQIVATFGATSSEGSALMLKRQRDFNVDNAAAEWRVQEGVVLITV